MKNKKVTAEISVSIPLLKDLSDDGFPTNLGALTLTCGNRNFILDSDKTNYENEAVKGGTYSFTTLLSVDLEIFEEDETFNYNLTEEDLASKELTGEFFCGLEDVEEEDADAFDMKNATIECTVYVDNKKYQVKGVKFEDSNY